MRKSDLAINSFDSGLRLKLSSSSGWTLQTATELRRTSNIDVRSHVFSLRRALKLRSACADAAGETSSRRISWQTCEYSARTSGINCFISAVACSREETCRVRQNICSCGAKSRVSSSGYNDNAASLPKTSPEVNTFSS